MALERVFDSQGLKQSPVNKEDLEEINLGTKSAPQKVYVGKRVSPKIRSMLIALLRKYKHVSTWSYDDLKAYRQDLFQHTIPLDPAAKPFRQKQRPINLVLKSKMQEDLMKLRDGGIIKPISHSSWVSNLVLVRKKNGDIRLCVFQEFKCVIIKG